MKYNLRAQKDYIMDQFDFAKVHKTLSLMMWAWYDKKTNTMLIPHIGMIRNQAERLLNQLIENDEVTEVSSGGLHGSKINNRLALRFVIEEVDNTELMQEVE